MKDAYERNEVENCETHLLFLMLQYNSNIKEGKSYDHDLKHILFRTNFIQNPMGIKYTLEDYEKTMEILLCVINMANAINSPDIDTQEVFAKNFTIDNRILKDILTVAAYTECFYNYSKVNSQRMDENEICQVAFVEQLISILVYYQDQNRLARNEYQNAQNCDYITGMEMLVANKQVQYYDDINCSMEDNFESILESMNEIIHYLYYRFGKKIELEIKVEDINFELIHPYENAEFEKYLYIAAQRYLLCRMEEGIRYGYYELKDFQKNQEGLKNYIFSLENDEKYRARSIGIFRREYQVRNHIMMAVSSQNDIFEADHMLQILAEELVQVQVEGTRLLDINRFYPKIDIFTKAEDISKMKEYAVEILTKEYYLDISVNNVKIHDLLIAYRYLHTLSEIKYVASLMLIDEEEQSTYVKEICLVDISYLVSELSRIHGYEKRYAESLIDRFIFHEKNNREDDIFAQPLLKISKSQVILSQALVQQVNLDRFIERQFIRNKKDVSEVGHLFEKKFISSLVRGYSKNILDLEYKKIPNFSVNTNKVQYDAFDGKQIEFDVIFVLGDYLVLTELKAIMTSYDLNDLEERKRNIKVAIAQLKRRAESVKYDWQKIKELVSIKLPDEPYDENHIVLVACTDAYDYTPLKYENVFITDDSTFLKYFTHPYVNAVKAAPGEASIYNIKSLWKKGYPDAKEFIEYLMNPVTTQMFSNYIEKQFVPIPVMDEKDYGVWSEVYRLVEDPIRESFDDVNEENLSLDNNFARKIYPNDPCPCGSGKKYKRCCKK